MIARISSQVFHVNLNVMIPQRLPLNVLLMFVLNSHLEKTSIKQLQVTVPLRMSTAKRATWKKVPIRRHLSFYMLLHCNFIVTLCIMLWLKIAVNHEALSIKTYSFHFLLSRIFCSCQLFKVIEHSSMKKSYKDTNICVYMYIYI